MAGSGACGGSNGHGIPAGYTKIDDMEGESGIIELPAPAGLQPGFWSSSTDCSEADRIAPTPFFILPNGWSYAAVPKPYRTMPGVSSTHAARLRTTSPLVGVWGANMGFDFADQPDPDGGAWRSPVEAIDAGSPAQGQPCTQGSSRDFNGAPVDLSAYSGLTFWAMASPGSVQTIHIRLDDRNTDPRGGICNASNPNNEQDCYNGFGTAILLTGDFTQYRVSFSDLQQNPTWGYRPQPDVLDLQHVYLVNFEVDLPSCAVDPIANCAGGPAPVSFDFWIDDLYFVNNP